MAVKNDVYEYLEKNADGYVSGEQIAEALGVSRSAVWKAVESLRKEGCGIEAMTRRGYRLTSAPDRLTAEGIGKALKYGDPSKITVYQETDSTNTRLRLMAMDGAPHGTAVVADKQTEGRGRLGRKFISPSGSGIYFSILLRPDTDMTGAIPVTTAAAVAVCESIRELTGRDAGIKWVNDIYIGGKKICGILTEAQASVENGGLDSVIVGIGINFRARPEEYPEDVQARAGWIYRDDEEGVSRNVLAADIIDRVIYFADHLEDRAFIEPYRKYSIVTGRDIVCIKGNERFDARAVDIDENGGLIIDTADGRQTLSTGEISIRWKK